MNAPPTRGELALLAVIVVVLLAFQWFVFSHMRP
jgi:hypothetical protein